MVSQETVRIQPSNSNDYIERRGSARIDIELAVKLRRNSCELGDYLASNISTGGLYLQGNCDSVFPGDVLNIDFMGFSSGDNSLHNMRALVLNRDSYEAHLTWLDCDSLFWVKLLKLLSRATHDTNAQVHSDGLLRGATAR